MSRWLVGEGIRHQVAIAGRVTDARTGKAVSGALVTIRDGPSASTAPDGHFHFLDLLPGDYMLVASLPGGGTRYGQSNEAKVEVSLDADGNIKLAMAHLKLPPTALQGRITNQDKKLVDMAEVRVVGSGERTFSDNKGEYCLTGLETGKRTVVASAQGYGETSITVTLEAAGQAVTGVELTLSPRSADELKGLQSI